MKLFICIRPYVFEEDGAEFQVFLGEVFAVDDVWWLPGNMDQDFNAHFRESKVSV